MNEKLRYVLSDKDKFDPYEGTKKINTSNKIIIPSRFSALDKIHRYGGKIADPFKVNVINQHEVEDRVFTSIDH